MNWIYNQNNNQMKMSKFDLKIRMNLHTNLLGRKWFYLQNKIIKIIKKNKLLKILRTCKIKYFSRNMT